MHNSTNMASVVPTKKLSRRAETERPLAYYDDVRSSLLLAQNASNGAIPEGLEYSSGGSTAVLRIRQDGNTFRLMHVPCMFGFTVNGYVLDYMFVSAKGALLALQHFNSRRESIVPNLRELLTTENGQECDLRMTMDFYDTERSARIASKILTDRVYQRGFPYEATAISGAVRSAVSVPLATLNTVRSVPQISYGSTSSSLDNRDYYKMFGRTIPSNDGDAQALLDYLSELGVSHLGILYVQDDYGAGFRISLETAASRLGIQVASVSIDVNQDLANENGSRGRIIDAVRALKSTGYRYFVGIIFTSHLDPLVSDGLQEGIMGPGYQWFMGDGVSGAAVIGAKFPQGSHQAIGFHGLGFIFLGAATHDGSYDRFKEELLARDSTTEFRSYFAAKTVSCWKRRRDFLPGGLSSDTRTLTASPFYCGQFPTFCCIYKPLDTDLVQFEANHNISSVSPYPPLAFDAVMALGIAGCRARNDFFSGEELFDEFTSVEFDGASGLVSIDASTGSRYYNSTE
jgi:hypothetical protein